MSDATEAIVAAFARSRVIPVVVIDDPGKAAPLGAALRDGGISCIEITFRTPRAIDALTRLVRAHPDLVVGAGTVLDETQLEAARGAGARFVVSPGFSAPLVDGCVARGLPVFPGVATPTEIMAARRHGQTVVKLFPAEPLGGLRYLQALAAPFPDVRFIPTGGITAELLPGYLRHGEVVACGGSWLVHPAWIEQGDFDRIREAARHALTVAGRGEAAETPAP